jgi:hypothetical protein
MLAITYKKITKIKAAEWGTPKKIFKKRLGFCDLVNIVQESLLLLKEHMFKRTTDCVYSKKIQR